MMWLSTLARVIISYHEVSCMHLVLFRPDAAFLGALSHGLYAPEPLSKQLEESLLAGQAYIEHADGVVVVNMDPWLCSNTHNSNFSLQKRKVCNGPLKL